MVVLTSHMHKKAEKPQYQGMIPNAEIFQSDNVARELHWSCELNWGLINHPNTNWTEGGKGELSPYLPYRNGGWPKSCRNFTKFSRRNKYTSQRLHVTSRQDARTLLNVKYKQIQKNEIKKRKDLRSILSQIPILSSLASWLQSNQNDLLWMIPNHLLLNFYFFIPKLG